MHNTQLSIQDICSIALCTAVIAVLAQLSIPIPSGVPMTLQTFAIILTAVILGGKKGSVSALIYVLLGAIGLPIFHNFTGGFQTLIGPTGGFLLSFPVMSFFAGYGSEKYKPTRVALLVTAGIIINHIAGVLMFCLVTGGTLTAAIAVCVIPFVPTTILQAILASLIGLRIKRRLQQYLL